MPIYRQQDESRAAAFQFRTARKNLAMSPVVITLLFLAFAGCASGNAILCVGMFVIGQALFETGMANKIGGLVIRFAKNVFHKAF